MRIQRMQICDMTDREYRVYKRRKRRQSKLRRRCLMVAMTLCLVAICAVSYHSIRISANTGEEQIYFKYYTNINVKHGETLWELADEYIDYGMYSDKNAYISEVQRINHLKEDSMLKAGQYLIMPYYSTEFNY